MILSMTGFGEAQLEQDDHAYHLDIRSVNNRYFKSSIRLPEDFAFMETRLEQMIRERLTRGSVALRLHMRDLSASAAQDMNLAAIQQYTAQLQSAAAAEGTFTIDLATLAMLPGVCQPHELTEPQRERAEALIMQLTETAVEKLAGMRRTEGMALAEDLQTYCVNIREQVQAIRSRVPAVLESYRDRLTARVQELLTGSNVHLATEDLLKEVAIYAERSDVSEELSRLRSHLEQFEKVMAGAESAGRKLDFIAQEMLREANTIGSKAGDAEIARRVIEIKSAIDRIKEQVQNVV